MFGLFRKKKYMFKCPICEGEYHVKFDPTELTQYDYEYRREASIVTKQKCRVCKVEMTVVLFKSGSVKAYDDKWQKYEREYDQKTDALGSKIAELEDILEENPKDEKARQELKRFQEQYDRLEESYDKKSEKYEERKTRCFKKREDKYGNH